MDTQLHLTQILAARSAANVRDWRRTSSGIGRLLAAFAVIAIVFGLLDHAAGTRPADAAIAVAYDSTLQGSSK